MNDQFYDGLSPAVSALAKELMVRSKADYLFESTDDPTLCRFPVKTRQRVENDAGFARGIMARAAEVKSASAADRVVLDTIGHKMALNIDAVKYYLYTFEFAPFYCMLGSTVRSFASFKLDSLKKREAYLLRLTEYAEYAEGLCEKTAEQYKAGIRLYTGQVTPSLENIAGLIHDAQSHPAYPEPSRLDGIAANEKADFIGRVTSGIQRVNNAFENLRGIIQETSGKRPEPLPGVSRYPDGQDYYRFLIRQFTGLDMTAEELYRLGMENINQIRCEIEDVAHLVGRNFTTVRQLNDSVRDEPAYKDKSKEQVAARYHACLEAVMPHMERYFYPANIPDCRAEPLDEALEKYVTFGYYSTPTNSRPEGIYYFNGSDLDSKSMISCAAMAYHELIPGHHYHFSRLRGFDAIPAFIAGEMDMAFVEGWAEYAAGLAGEMGLYSDPYYRFGRLQNRLFVSIRLVVDAGLNALGMTMEEAYELMRDNLTLSDGEIRSELLRYGTDMPGQALSYGIGSTIIMNLREQAAKTAGPAFDIRDFHEDMMRIGAVPLSVAANYITDKYNKEGRK